MSSSSFQSLPFSARWGPLGSTPLSNGISEGKTPTQVFGYEVIGFLGQGAGSRIYAASNRQSGQIYALKHVVVKTEKDQRFIDQLQNEFEIGTKVNHPLLRRSIDLKQTRSILRKVTEAALVMELFEGVSCEVYPPTDLSLLTHIFHQTALALVALHQQGYVHCDLKPNNILVSAAGGVKIIDLGQACPIGSVKERIQGTPDFIAPEQVRREPVSPQTDIYNLGATFYFLLSGQKLPTLFTLKKSPNSFLVSNAVPSPSELNPRIPQNLSALVMECVRVSASRRPADMANLARRMDVIQHTISAARSPSPLSA